LNIMILVRNSHGQRITRVDIENSRILGVSECEESGYVCRSGIFYNDVKFDADITFVRGSGNDDSYFVIFAGKQIIMIS